MTTKIQATRDALGNPTGFHLTPGQAHDLEGADALLPRLYGIEAPLADKARDAEKRVLERLRNAGIEIYLRKTTDAKNASTIKTNTDGDI